MNLRILHVLCSTDESVSKVHDAVSDCDAVVQAWSRENEDSHSLFYLVNEQDQELFDELQDMSGNSDSIRMIIQPVDASFPKNYRDEEQEAEENEPGFFDIISREEMTEIVAPQARLNGTYLSLVALSAVVATIALIQGNVAVLIGAMVLTPLLGPNLALTFAAATGQLDLMKRAVISGTAGAALTLLIAAATGFATGVSAGDDITTMLVSFGFESLLVAACAGIAATLLLLQGGLSALIGVMVAVAFLPPLAMTGLSLGTGNYYTSLNALLLFSINVSVFNLSANGVLLLAGIRPHRSDQDELSKRVIAVYLSGWIAAICLLSVGLYFKP